jgi:hypothetical protein
MKSEPERREPPVDNAARMHPIESFLWVAIPIAVVIVLAWIFWP